MRDLTSFINEYESTFSVDHQVDSDAAKVDLCLHFLNSALNGENIDAIPYLLSGYSNLLKDNSQNSRLASLRHIAFQYASVNAWRSALENHRAFPETLRAYSVKENIPYQRRTASNKLLDILDKTLLNPVPYRLERLDIARPGPGYVYTNYRKTRIPFTIPIANFSQAKSSKYDLKRRPHNPPIVIDWQELERVAHEVDKRELSSDWDTTNLKPLNLASRLKRVKVYEAKSGFFQNNRLCLDGTNHLVGMLSSGKSTLVMSLLFTLTQEGYNKKILVISPDTYSATILSTRLNHHGISSTVLSSFKNRDEHLNSIHWHHGMTLGGWSIDKIGDLTRNFGVACPLNGYQKSLEGAHSLENTAINFPGMSEKPCHGIEQDLKVSPVTDNETPQVVFNPEKARRSCPLFTRCPAQSQQREAVSAQVVIMTPAAFIHMMPDKNLLSESMSFPELIQYTRDLVIIDEADSVQNNFDEQFALQQTIMGGGDDTYIPDTSVSLSDAIRKLSGYQYRSSINRSWHRRLNRLSDAVASLYWLLQNYDNQVRWLYRNQQFTTALILCRLWRRRHEQNHDLQETFSIEGTIQQEFIHILNVASSIGKFAEEESDNDNETELSLQNLPKEYHRAVDKFVKIRTQLMLIPVDQVVPEVLCALDDELLPFNASQESALNLKAQILSREENAYAIIMALLTDIVLSNFNYLAKNQAAVAQAYDLDSNNVFRKTKNLLNRYRTLIPSNPAGNVFGLFYEEPDSSQGARRGGNLKLVNHLGVGRYLLTNLSCLLSSEGQAGPHVLLLSGTSWAGGKMKEKENVDGLSEHAKPISYGSIASPLFDVQVKVSGILQQPPAELEQLNRSVFKLVDIRDKEGNQISVSGQPIDRRQANLGLIAKELTRRYSGTTRLDAYWDDCEKKWGQSLIYGRRRALLVVNSYNDAAVVANTIQSSIESGNSGKFKVYALVRDEKTTNHSVSSSSTLIQNNFVSGIEKLPRSLVEEFGHSDERSILVAPISVISRGHNILTKQNPNNSVVAAISAIYFLHRPHPRPDDLSPIIGQLNRYAIDCVNANDDQPLAAGSIASQGQYQKYLAGAIARQAHAARQSYFMMPSQQKAQFAWDLITILWQTVGRGIRGGVPVFVGFIDHRFAPQTFSGELDTKDSSCLMQCVAQLELAIASEHNLDHGVASLLYQPFYQKLRDLFSKLEEVSQFRKRQ